MLEDIAIKYKDLIRYLFLLMKEALDNSHAYRRENSIYLRKKFNLKEESLLFIPRSPAELHLSQGSSAES